jgi:hypothetical protein
MILITSRSRKRRMRTLVMMSRWAMVDLLTVSI